MRVMGLKTVFNVSLCCLMLTSVIFSSGCLDDTGTPSKEPVDTDGDGVIDASDAFPLDPSESRDTDLDGVGDNADAFPNNPNENADSDNDGIGDNSDAFPNDACHVSYESIRTGAAAGIGPRDRCDYQHIQAYYL